MIGRIYVYSAIIATILLYTGIRFKITPLVGVVLLYSIIVLILLIIGYFKNKEEI